jgi:hypothetical protein
LVLLLSCPAAPQPAAAAAPEVPVCAEPAVYRLLPTANGMGVACGSYAGGPLLLTDPSGTQRVDLRAGVRVTEASYASPRTQVDWVLQQSDCSDDACFSVLRLQGDGRAELVLPDAPWVTLPFAGALPAAMSAATSQGPVALGPGQAVFEGDRVYWAQSKPGGSSIWASVDHVASVEGRILAVGADEHRVDVLSARKAGSTLEEALFWTRFSPDLGDTVFEQPLGLQGAEPRGQVVQRPEFGTYLYQASNVAMVQPCPDEEILCLETTVTRGARGLVVEEASHFYAGPTLPDAFRSGALEWDAAVLNDELWVLYRPAGSEQPPTPWRENSK